MSINICPRCNHVPASFVGCLCKCHPIRPDDEPMRPTEKDREIEHLLLRLANAAEAIRENHLLVVEHATRAGAAEEKAEAAEEKAEAAEEKAEAYDSMRSSMDAAIAQTGRHIADRERVEEALGYYPSEVGTQWPDNVVAEVKEGRERIAELEGALLAAVRAESMSLWSRCHAASKCTFEPRCSQSAGCGLALEFHPWLKSAKRLVAGVTKDEGRS